VLASSSRLSLVSLKFQRCLLRDAGEQMGADEALKLGLVAKVFPASETISEALKTAAKIAQMSQPAVEMCKDAVNQSYEMGLQQGLLYESRAFWSTFATNDQKEGMKAFMEKRKPNFTDD